MIINTEEGGSVPLTLCLFLYSYAYGVASVNHLGIVAERRVAVCAIGEMQIATERCSLCNVNANVQLQNA